jgi:hypothetical protein
MRLQSALLLLALSGPALAQATLSLNGSTTATLPPGGILVATATLPPGTPAVIAYDVSPGPASIFGELVPLGFTTSLDAVGAPGVVPDSGIFVSTVTIPDLAFLVGSDFYLCGLAIDPNDPNGIAFTTGATLSIRIASNAGCDRAAFTGETIAFDGGANAASAGSLLPGDAVSWQILSAPAGSVAALAGATTLYPTITPDLPGDYFVAVTLLKGGIPLAPSMTKLTAFQASGFSLADGQIHSETSLALTGTIVPAASIASVTVDGTTVAVSPSGTFTVPALSWLPGQVTRPIDIEVTSSSGKTATQQMTVLNGVAAATAPAIDSATQLRITKETFDLVAGIVPLGMTQAQFSSMVNIAPITYGAGALGISFGSLTIDPTGGSYSSLTCSASCNATDVLYTTTITNAKVNLHFSGSVLFVTFNTTGSVSATITMKSHVKFTTPTTGPNAGLLQFNVTTENPQISNPSINLGSIPGVITNVVSGFVNTIYTSLAQGVLKSAIQSVVNLAMVPFNLQLDNISVNLGALYKQSILFTSVAHSTDGVTAVAKMDLTPNLPPTGPNLPEYLAGEGPLDPFGATIPGIGGTYNWGTAITVDGLNALLAKYTNGGIINITFEELAQQLGQVFGSVVFTAQELAQILPTAGFERLPPLQIVKVKLEASVAPIVKGNPNDSILALEFAGVKAKFLTIAPGSAFEVEFLTLLLETKGTLKEELSGPKFNPKLQEKTPAAKLGKGMPTAKKKEMNEGAGGRQFADPLAALVEKALQKITLPGYTNPGGFISKPPEKVGPMGGKKAVGAWVKFQ